MCTNSSSLASAPLTQRLQTFHAYGHPYLQLLPLASCRSHHILCTGTNRVDSEGEHVVLFVVTSITTEDKVFGVLEEF
jgi:hypothetical protein